MKWSEMSYSDYYFPFDENQRAIRGFFLTTLHVDLEAIPYIYNQPFEFFNSSSYSFSEYCPRKVFLRDIAGTSYKDYGGMSIIQSFMRIKRGGAYISNGMVTRGKYFYMLKRPVFEQNCPIALSYDTKTGKYWVDSNGNHRIVFYKMMMLSEIAEKYEWSRSEDYDLEYAGFEEITNRYWLNAMVREVL